MLNIRPAVETDVPEIFAMINELAEYEKAPDEVTSTEEDVRTHLFGENPRVYTLITEVDGKVQGMAMWFLNYSTWHGRHGIWLEDLYVREQARGNGIGTALLKALAKIAVDNDYRRVEWTVLRWNEPSIGFYSSIGAHDMGEWTTMRLDGEALKTLGS